MKDVTLSGCIDKTLRSQFAEASEKVGRPAAQIVRELMRDFVASTRTARAPLSNLELFYRRRAVDFARANVELEGYKTPPGFADELEKLVRGEIDVDDIHRETERLFGHLRIK